MKCVSAMSCGAAVSVGSGIFLAWFLGGLDLWAGAGSLLLGGIAAWRAFVSVAGETQVSVGGWDIFVLGVFVWAVFRAFFWVLFPEGDALKVLSPHNLGDMALHLGLIEYFASGIAFWPPSPILVGVPLTYPPGADFFNALLVVVGGSLRGGLVAVGVAWSLASAWALWRYGGAFAVAAFLFGGGLVGFEFLRTGEWLEYGSDGIWKNAFLTMLVTQRGFLFALPAGLVLLWAWRQEFFDSSSRKIPLAWQVVMYASLPLFQLHTFLFLSAALAFAVVVHPRGWRRPVMLVVWSFVPATLGVLAVTDGLSAGGAARWEPGWALEPAGLRGFALEFGVAIGLGIWLLVLTWTNHKEAPPSDLSGPGSQNLADRWMTGVSVLVAAVAFLIPLTDWAWDNTKLLIWAWIAPAPCLWSRVLAPQPVLSRAVLCLLLFFGGAIALVSGLDLRHGYDLARRSELAEWRMKLAEFPQEAVFAISPDYNHPVLLLGRRVVCGYEGHLSSHGLDYTSTLQSLRRILAQEPGWQAEAGALAVDALALRASETPTGEIFLKEISSAASPESLEHSRTPQ